MSRKKIGETYIPIKYEQISAKNPKAYKCNKTYFVNTNISPGIFLGGCPIPPQLYGCFGPAKMYKWTDYIKKKNKAKIYGTLDFILGTSNGTTIIRWNKNYQIKDGSTASFPSLNHKLACTTNLLETPVKFVIKKCKPICDPEFEFTTCFQKFVHIYRTQ